MKPLRVQDGVASFPSLVRGCIRDDGQLFKSPDCQNAPGCDSDVSGIVRLLEPSGLSPRTKIFLSSDANSMQETTRCYTIHNAPTYVASVKPALESDRAENCTHDVSNFL